jgi:putative DNA primase/helicase
LENVGNLKKPEIGENARVGTTDQTDLFRVRLVTSVEVEDGRRFAESLIKEMIGGERIRARRMKENFWEFEPTHKAIIVANHHPEVCGTDTGIWRRIKLVPFDVVILAEERNPRLMEELEAEYEGILAWMVEGGLQWRHLGLSEPEPIEPIKTATQEYRDDMDVLANFILTRCVEGPGVSVYSTPLYNEYKQWAKASQSEARINSMIGLARVRAYQL